MRHVPASEALSVKFVYMTTSSKNPHAADTTSRGVAQLQDNTMSTDMDKENIAEGMLTADTLKAPTLSPKRSGMRSRSQSIGPGGLNVPLKQDAGNRRKVITTRKACS